MVGRHLQLLIPELNAEPNDLGLLLPYLHLQIINDTLLLPNLSLKTFALWVDVKINVLLLVLQILELFNRDARLVA